MNAASQTAPGLIGAAAGVLENARAAVELDPVRIASESAERRASRRLWRAVVLAPDLETCEALLHDEAVPLDRLDPEWARRFGVDEVPA